MNKDTNKGEWPYEDIVDLPHHVSSTHIPMPMNKRAAQFAPFAALVGFHEAIERTAQEWTAEHENVNEIPDAAGKSKESRRRDCGGMQD